jgi:hypothetical protein
MASCANLRHKTTWGHREFFHPDTGKLVQWFGTSTDIHEHKQADAQLRQSAERVRLATDQKFARRGHLRPAA